MSNLALSQSRVLVVDDNADAADLLVLLLTAMEVSARAVYSGAEAVAVAEDMAPAFIFLDLDMPHMSGYEVARELRARSRFKSTVIVALTGRSDAATRQGVMTRGFDMHLPKPATVDQLQAILMKTG